ncbi:hypothetical protein CcaverHIS002_0501560 [Cutaneotrichosporon cavernicola]|uniref:Uncharacterized protein n=1 Tax=Cutaneotrichosporon cavernicola TaxID=279322 RepID=A0AA48L607_9TREE|nr:uncharacterized protein CcaverHIS019_0502160 [Cutaneotrichosporon cavernicola]BEI84755.1 hypothetical protein CcaverHIS002_0501560 [Cutaneotrichosporon cavernicola]BEI92588.1 hypothetical protein CcaverHIS019_0502160 [Cutaneotrichosporon cavernicola]BEJ00363.1 hypothetical protein CcaverHIS631_0502200 [Cutaneotrichosporon cavernicola]BEJ08133.1 hypothetical protein CcaverHIS641_0502180 [Cutaneotrichosporon cavernicola]
MLGVFRSIIKWIRSPCGGGNRDDGLIWVDPELDRSFRGPTDNLTYVRPLRDPHFRVVNGRQMGVEPHPSHRMRRVHFK